MRNSVIVALFILGHFAMEMLYIRDRIGTVRIIRDPHT